MTTRPGHLTTREIAAENRKARTAEAQAALAARLEVEGKVAGGPFDPTVDTDADEPPDETPPLPLVPTGRRVAHPPTCGACHGAGCPEFEAPPVDDATAERLEAKLPLDPVAEIRTRLAAATAPEAVEAGRFAAGPEPRIVDGLIVPARSVADNPLATWVLIPVGEVASIGVTGRAVGITPHHGRWLALWIGDDRSTRDAVLERFAADYANNRKARR